VPKKDEVQEEVSKMKNLQIKTSIEKETTLNFPVLYDSRTKEAFLMHVMVVLDAIKKRAHFMDYEEAQKAYIEQKEAMKSAKDGLAWFDGASKGLGKFEQEIEESQESQGESQGSRDKVQGSQWSNQAAQRPHEGKFPS
jgi:hypothetical protein